MADQFLLADVGASNTRVGLGGPNGLETHTVATFRNAKFTSLEDVLSGYLAETPARIDAICAGVAGPVREGGAQLTNLDWFIAPEALGAAMGVDHVHLMNDLQAQGYALDDLPEACVSTLFPGVTPPPGATRLVMGLGTGSNIAVVHQAGHDLFVPPSETGHTSLPHLDGDAAALIGHLAELHYHKPMEAALSGPGLARTYRFVCGETLPAPEIIARHAEGDMDAGIALRLFVEILGTVAGNIALTHLPMGGFYFIGGLARGLAPFLDELGFLDHFTAKGPYSQITRDIPIRLIDDDFAALHGCARFLRQV